MDINKYLILIKDEDKTEEIESFVVLHRQLRVIIKNFSLINEEEIKFVNNENTHIDFLIYSKINKQIVLAIEVDGYKYHEDSPIQRKRDKLKDEILEKYNIPIIRFATNASQESKKLKECLKNLYNLFLVFNNTFF